jgi:translation elongation factor EF-G
MTKTPNLSKSTTTKSAAEKILATVPYVNGFHFFTSIGQYTGETAVSLATFAKEVEATPIESIDFHFKKADFQKWIEDTLETHRWFTRNFRWRHLIHIYGRKILDGCCC